MTSINHQLDLLVKRLTRTDEQTIKSVISRVSNLMTNNSGLRIAETWVSGSIGKGTNIKGQGDIDLVFLLSPKEAILNEDTLFEKVRATLKASRISSIEPQTAYKATKICVSGISVDILITQYGAQGRLGETQDAVKQVKTIIRQGPLFTNTARILKYWKLHDPNLPLKGYITSFEIEIILGKVFHQKQPHKYDQALIEFFTYVVSSKLKNTVVFPPTGKPLLHKTFTFRGREHFVNRARHALTCLQKTPSKLTFLGLN